MRMAAASFLALSFALAACSGEKEPPAPPPIDSSAGADRAEIRVVGSSTIHPFAEKVREAFIAKGGPEVALTSTGTGAGQIQFCESLSMDTPDIVTSSRPQEPAEAAACAKNGVTGVLEVKFGFDGIVVGQSKSAAQTEFSIQHFYAALAKTVPTSNYDCTPVPNPNKKWSDIDPSLPDTPIKVYGPPKSSGTRDVFLQAALEPGAKRIACLDAMSATDHAAFAAAVHELREDGAWVDETENDNDIVKALGADPKAYGVFGYSFLVENPGVVKAAMINGIEPTFENIATGKYRLSRPLYLYIKTAHYGRLPAIRDFALEFLSDAASGEAGYLKPMGLVPLPAAELAASRAAVEAAVAPATEVAGK